jgi:hypothetical protein
MVGNNAFLVNLSMLADFFGVSPSEGQWKIVMRIVTCVVLALGLQTAPCSAADNGIPRPAQTEMLRYVKTALQRSGHLNGDDSSGICDSVTNEALVKYQQAKYPSDPPDSYNCEWGLPLMYLLLQKDHGKAISEELGLRVLTKQEAQNVSSICGDSVGDSLDQMLDHLRSTAAYAYALMAKDEQDPRRKHELECYVVSLTG